MISRYIKLFITGKISFDAAVKRIYNEIQTEVKKSMQKTALVVVDMQNDFIDGVLGSPEAKAIVPLVCEYIKNFKGGYIFATQDQHLEEDYHKSVEG